MKVLVTGCCGYIGSHTCVELIKAGYEVVGLDNFSNSNEKALDSIATFFKNPIPREIAVVKIEIKIIPPYIFFIPGQI